MDINKMIITRGMMRVLWALGLEKDYDFKSDVFYGDPDDVSSDDLILCAMRRDLWGNICDLG
jgi:hypothetical protein